MMPKLLLVEDEAGLRLTLSDRLASEGYAVETASDGQSGFERAARGGYDLVVLDVMLPRMNGFDVCRELRRSICPHASSSCCGISSNIAARRCRATSC